MRLDGINEKQEIEEEQSSMDVADDNADDTDDWDSDADEISEQEATVDEQYIDEDEENDDWDSEVDELQEQTDATDEQYIDEDEENDNWDSESDELPEQDREQNQNDGYSIADVSDAVDSKEEYEAEIRNMSAEEYRDQKELDQRVEEYGSEPDMYETTVPNEQMESFESGEDDEDPKNRRYNSEAEIEKNEEASMNEEGASIEEDATDKQLEYVEEPDEDER